MNAAGVLVTLMTSAAIGCVITGGGAVEFLGLVLANVDRVVLAFLHAAGVL